MALKIRRDGGSPATTDYIAAGEGDFFQSTVVTQGAVSLRTNRTLSGSRQVGKDGTVRSMLKITVPLSLAGLVPAADPTKPTSPAQLTLHVVMSEAGILAQLKDNPAFEALVLRLEREMATDLCVLLIGSLTNGGVYVNGETDMAVMQRLSRGSRPFVDGETYGADVFTV